MYVFLLLLAVAITIPPSAKVIAISVTVYGVMQMLKRTPFAAQVQGWWAVLFNGLFSALGVIIATPAAQLYTTDTAVMLIQAIAAAAGIHGTIKALGQGTPAGNIAGGTTSYNNTFAPNTPAIAPAASSTFTAVPGAIPSQPQGESKK